MARGQTSQSKGGSLAHTRRCVKSPRGTGWGEAPEQQEVGVLVKMFPSIQTTDGERKDSVEEKTNASPKSRTGTVGAGVLWTQGRPL